MGLGYLRKRFARRLFAGGFRPPTPGSFSLSGQRKGTKRKAARMPHPLRGSPALLSQGGGLHTGHPGPSADDAPSMAHPPSGPFPPWPPLLGEPYGTRRTLASLAQEALRAEEEGQTYRSAHSERHDIGRILRPRMPRRAPQSESDEARRGRARDGASSALGAGGPVCRPPIRTRSAGNRRRRRGIRAAFLWGTFLWPRKEKYLVAGGRKPPSK